MLLANEEPEAQICDEDPYDDTLSPIHSEIALSYGWQDSY